MCRLLSHQENQSMSRFFLFCSFLHTSARMGKPAGRVDHRPEILEEGVGGKCCCLYLPRKKMHVPRRAKANVNRPRPRTLAESLMMGPCLVSTKCSIQPSLGPLESRPFPKAMLKSFLLSEIFPDLFTWNFLGSCSSPSFLSSSFFFSPTT